MTTTIARLQNWNGTLELGEDWAAWRGSVGDTSSHHHFAAQAVIATAPLAILDEKGEEHLAPVFLIEPQASHQMQPATQEVLIVFVEPRRVPAAGMPLALRAALTEAQPSAWRIPHAAVGSDRFWSTGWLEATPLATWPLDAWEGTVRQAIDAQLSHGRLSVKDVASHVHLSSERFRHLFAERFGMPFRRFVLWRRLRHAALSLQDGGNATEAAHHAGFSDAAHFARTLRETFGVTVTQSLRSRR